MGGFKYGPLPCTVKYNSTFKKQEVWSFATLSMNIEDNLINGINQVRRDEDRLMSYGKNLRKQRRKGFPEAGGGAAGFQLDGRVDFTALYVTTIRNDVFFRIAKE